MNEDQIPQEFWTGVEQFNQKQFYACHDTLEALWLDAGQPQKTFYQGILQIAVALYHLDNHNWLGSAILLGEGISRLHPYQPNYAGINVTLLLQQSSQLLTVIQQLGPDKVAEVVAQLGQSPELAQDNCRLPEIKKAN